MRSLHSIRMAFLNMRRHGAIKSLEERSLASKKSSQRSEDRPKTRPSTRPSTRPETRPAKDSTKNSTGEQA